MTQEMVIKQKTAMNFLALAKKGISIFLSISMLFVYSYNVTAQTVVTEETFPNQYNTSFGSSNNTNGTFIGSSGTWTASCNSNVLSAIAVIQAYYTPRSSYAIKIVNWNTSGKGAADCHAASPTVNLTGNSCSQNIDLSFNLYTYTCNASDATSFFSVDFSSDGGSTWTTVYSKSSAQLFNTYGSNGYTNISIPVTSTYRVSGFKYRFNGIKPANNPYNFYVFVDDAKITASSCSSSSGERCFVSPTNPSVVWAKSTWTTNASNQTVTIRTALSKSFVDNCYKPSGNADNWNRSHKFGDLDGSDKLGWSLKDANGNVKLAFEQDYIGSSNAFPSGYGTLGFSGNGSNPSPGNATDVTAFMTSLDRNLNFHNYVLLSTSPSTDSNYTPNPSYPNWIFDVWYEVTVKLSAFGAAGFGFPDIASMHASPSKTGNNSETVVPTNCIASLGDYVWNDTNGNGIQDNGEPGIQGVTVTLTKPDLTTATTTTNASGFYQFSNLTAGSYKVTFPTTLAGGLKLTGQDRGNDDTKDSDPHQGTGIVNGITLFPGQTNNTVDAGYVLANMALGNKVFFDANRSGVFDAGDGPIANTIVRLYTDNNNDNIADGAPIALTTTDANGIYGFANLVPGNYIVGADLPNGNAITVINGGDPDNDIDNDNNATTQVGIEARGMGITLSPGNEPTAGNTNNTYDFGFYNPIAPPNGGENCFSGTNTVVWAKSHWNANVNSQTVTLRVTFAKAFVDNCYQPSGNADNWNRSHTFGNLTGSDHLQWSIRDANGVEKLAFKQDYISAGAAFPSGYGCLGFGGDGGTPTVGSTTDVLSFRTSLATNFNDYGYVMVNNSPPTDTNYTPNPAQPNWIYDVWYEVTVKTSVFGAAGFGFVNVASVHASPSKTGNNTEIITNNPCASGSIGDRVWNDVNKNGTQDAGEVGLAGVVVTLYDGATNKVLATTITDGYGNYKFANLETSVTGINYQVRFSQVAGFQFSPNNGAITVTNNSDANPATGRTGTITLTNAVPNVTYVDAGLYYTEFARLGDFVWNDLNKNGIQEAGEPGIAGVTVMLYTTGDVLYRSTVTSNNGYYFFNDVAPGSYYVKVAPPIGYQVSPKNAGGSAVDSDIDPVTRKTGTITVVNGTNDLTIDAGLNVTPTTGASASLGDRVWEDLNNDNLQTAGEPGIANVTVQLYNTSNTLLATVTTDAFGNYIFNGLMPGSYYVKFTLPAGFSYVTAKVGTNDDIDSDADAGTGNSPTVTLVADEVNLKIDAGMRRITAGANLGDYVWYDLNKNGTQDGGNEVGVPGITVVLYNSSNVVIQTATTNINGFYLFTGLTPSTVYTVGFENIPAGYGFSPNNGAITLAANSDVNPFTGRTGNVTTGAAGSTINYVDAGLIINPNTFDSKSTVGDRVWNDLNNNGIQDSGEPGIPGVTVTLFAANGTTVLGTTTTDALGYYLFTNLNAGSYVVGFSGLPAGYVFAPKDAGTDDTKDSDADIATGKTAPFTLAAGEINLTIDAGARNTSTTVSAIGNFVWFDVNNNGIQDAGEPGVPGVSVKLTNMANNIVGTTTTSANGEYLFTDLPAGNYFVEFTNLPAGYIAGIKNAAGSNAANNSDPNTATAKTDIIVLPASTIDRDWDFGIVTTTRASLGDFVWNDTNGNGIQDSGEQGVAGVTVTLYDNNNVAVAKTVTDNNGFYLFVNLTPATYSVEFGSIPASSSFTLQAVGGSAVDSDPNPATGRTASFALSAGQNKRDIDAGLLARFAAVGNYVWNDVNGNGIQDAAEPGLAGVTVIIYNSSNVPVGSAVTDANGYYFINNIPVPAAGASFTIKFVDTPTAMVFTTKNAVGSTTDNDSDANVATGTTDVFTLVPGQVRLDIDAGLRFVNGSIGDRVWNDLNKNGIQDAGEVGVAGVTVTLFDNANNVYASTVTDAFGIYKFSNLPVSGAGSEFQVRFSLPAGYAFSPMNVDLAGITGVANSDANTGTGRTTTVTLTPTVPDVTYVDAGIIYTVLARIGDYVWNDLNKNGIQEAGEPGLAGVPVMLYTSANVLYRSTVTANNGYYFFNDLPAGTYYIKVAPPIGYQVSPKDAAADDIDSDIDPVTRNTPNFIVVAGTNNLTLDAGLNVTSTTGASASLGDKVWEDLNNNNIQDAGEPGIANVTVRLLDGVTNGLLATVVTDAFGNYIFNGLVPGDYFVRFILPSGFGFVTSNVGTNVDIDSDADAGSGNTQTITLAADEVNTSIDAGMRRTIAGANLGDYVWYDLNKNGTQDGGDEVGVPGVTVVLYNSSNVVVKTTTTNSNGFYLFTGLTPSTVYTVGFENIPAGYGFSPNNGAITLAANSDVNPFTGRTGNVTTGAAGSTINYVDAGLIINPNTFDSKSTVGDRVWNDLNNNGIQDPGEPGIAGVTVTLYASNGTTVIATTTTDALGNYLFTNLDAGSYVVGFSGLPAGYVFAPKDAGTDDTKDSDADIATGKTAPFTLAAGEINLTIDAGARNSTTGLSSIGDFVWYDLNTNGIQDAGEPGAAGVSVALKNSVGAVIKTTTTSSTGFYLFTDLAAGTYTLQFGNLPAGFTATTQNAAGGTAANNSDANATTLATGNIVLPANTNDTNWDMGIKSTTRASVGDYVWNDTNGNGIQEAGEPGIAGVTVTLYDNANNPLATSITDANGFYAFSNVLPGTYSVGFGTIPASSSFTLQNAAGSTAANNSDVDPATGRTATFTLTAGQSRTDIDAGLVSYKASVGDYVWHDLNRDGIQDANEPGVPGITVTMYSSTDAIIGNGDDVAVASAVTDANGYYFINNVSVPQTGFSQFYMRYTDILTGYNTFTSPLVGGTNASNNSKVTQADINNGRTGFFSLNPNQVYRDMDAGVSKQINIYGNLWHDANALIDNEVNRTSNIAVPVGLYIYLVDDATGMILQTESFEPDGTYHFLDVEANKSYRIVLSSILAFPGQMAPAARLPTGWRNTGENLGAGPNSGSDGVVNGILFVDVLSEDVYDANFGIRKQNGEVIVG